MPRPQRIEYENAFYHVMNRGRGRQTIFHSDEYFQAFLAALAEAQQRFGCVVHAYCLMSNHYHLLIETPNANLSRIMRHVNGVYTQRYNRLQQTDGSLFRGRYKVILVDQDAYLLQLSRYIHSNSR
jgi:putative transposase